MSDPNHKINQMRSLIIHAASGESVVELLKNSNVNGWEWASTGFPSPGHQYCLKKGNEFVAIAYDYEYSDRARSSNVMPYDSKDDPKSANKLLKELSEALTEAEIDNSVIASVNDLTE